MHTYCWKVQETVDGGEICHTVTCALSRLRGRLLVAVDEDEYTLPAGVLGLSVKRREMLQVGELKALLVLTRTGKATLIVEGKPMQPVLS